MVEKRSSHGSILPKTAEPHSNLKIMDNYLNLMLLTAFSTESKLFVNQLRLCNYIELLVLDSLVKYFKIIALIITLI